MENYPPAPLPTKQEKVEFKSLIDALKYLDCNEASIGKDVETYKHHVKELTGVEPGKQLSPMDVVKIVQKVFNL